jgi:uncharacterized repeat protein (TIGR02543 family)
VAVLSSPSAISENSEITDYTNLQEDTEDVTPAALQAAEMTTTSGGGAAQTEAKASEAESVLTESAPQIKPDRAGVISPLSVPDISDVCTVTFKAAGSPDDKKVEVAKGEKCPVQSPPAAESGKVFAGWYYIDEEDAEHQFNFSSDIITEDLTLTARFDVAGYTVQFLSGSLLDGVVLYSANVSSSGATLAAVHVDIPDSLTPPGQVFAGEWYIGDTIGDTNEIFQFDITPVTKNLKLVPKFVPGYHVWFVTNGENAIEPQIVQLGGNAVRPSGSDDPKRKGYTFAGWYEKKDLSGSPFDFSSGITKSMTLYGKWTGDNVDYTVVYWLEKPNLMPDNYPEPTWTLKDQTPAAQGSGELSYDQIHDVNNYIFAYSEKKTSGAPAGTSINAPSAGFASSGIKAINELLDPLTTGSTTTMKFAKYAWGNTNVQVAGDGSTVVNVYFTRNIWTVNYNITSPDAANQIITATMVNAEVPYYQGTVAGRNTLVGTYTIKTKIGFDMTGIEPATISPSGTYLITAKTNPTDTRYWVPNGWGPTKSYRPEPFGQEFINAANSYDNNARTVTNNPGWMECINPKQFFVHYYVESLDQESSAPSIPVNSDNTVNQRIWVPKIYANNGTSELATVNKYMEILTTFAMIHSNIDSYSHRQVATLKTGFTTYDIVGGVPIYGGNVTGDHGSNFQFNSNSRFYQLSTSALNSKDTNRYFFYSRNKYNITFNAYGGTKSDETSVADQTNIPYETPLYTYDPGTLIRDKDVFLGWYEDSDYTIPFSFTDEKGNGIAMPAHHLNLYAKWLINPHTVSFYENATATVPITALNQQVEHGTPAYQPEDLPGLADGATFNGWYIKLSDGTFTPYSFEMPVNDDLKVYARWYPAYQPYSVIYNGNGAISGAEPPSDPDRYALGSKAIAKDGDNLITPDGDVFIGWKLGSESDLYHPGNTFLITSALANAERKITLFAQYALPSNTVSITFKRNTPVSDLSEEWPTVKNAVVTYPIGSDLDDFAYEGHRFIGWSTTAGGSVNSSYTPGNSAKLPTPLTLFAKWEAIDYTVQYLPGEQGAFDAKVTTGLRYSGITPPKTPDAPVTTGRPGWRFTGWDKAIAPNVTEDREYIAQWSRINYTVTYHGNGETGGNAPDVTGHYYNDTVSVQDKNTLTKEGYTFLGWSKTSGASDITYAPADTFAITANMNLYAVWKKNPDPVLTPPAITPTPPAITPTPPAITPTPPAVTLTPPAVTPPTTPTHPVTPGQATPAQPPVAAQVTVPTPEVTPEELIPEPPEPGEPAPAPAPVPAPESAEGPRPTNSVTKVTPPAGYENFTAKDIAKFEGQTGNLFTDLIRNKIPLGNIFGKGAWSLLSLLLSLIAVVISVLLILWVVIRRRGRDDEHDRDTYSEERYADERYAEESGETVKKKNASILRALTVIVGVLTPIVWLILDDLNQPMVWINKWTLYVGIVFIVHIVLLLVYKSRNNRKVRDSEAEAEYSNSAAR